MEGFLLVHKPPGLTSHDVVHRIRRLTKEKRVGHAGTLDPFATGLLIVGVGRGATREMNKLVGLDKTYEAVFVLGALSDTDDRTGTITESQTFTTPISYENLKKNLDSFVGTIEQIPPDYSAIKIKGQKMYEAARAGNPLKANPRRVTIYAITSLAILPPSPTLTFQHVQAFSLIISCSSGTYIRSIARDLGTRLQVGGYVEALCRTAIGPFELEEAFTLEQLEKNGVQSALKSTTDLLSRLNPA